MGGQAGRQAGRQASKQADEIQVSLKIFLNSLQVKLFGLLFVYYHCNVTTVLELHFSQLLSSKAYFIMCFEVQKFGLPFFSCTSLLLSTSVPNNNINYSYINMYVASLYTVVWKNFKITNFIAGVTQQKLNVFTIE